MRIVSGGQTGADRGGLDAAIELDIDHGGWCPRGRKAEDGHIPDHYRLVETGSSDYRKRTELNVRDSNATIIFVGEVLSGGSALTETYCDKHHKHCLVVYLKTGTPFPELMNQVHRFLEKWKPVTLNIAGSRESKVPGIQEMVQRLLVSTFMELSGDY